METHIYQDAYAVVDQLSKVILNQEEENVGKGALFFSLFLLQVRECSAHVQVSAQIWEYSYCFYLYFVVLGRVDEWRNESENLLSAFLRNQLFFFIFLRNIVEKNICEAGDGV